MQRSITSKPDQASNRRGFTIVELLIVVVVVGILAAITIVSYGGVKQRATNTAIVDAASKSLSMITAYITVNNAYPSTSSTGGDVCITTTSVCNWTGLAYPPANSTFDSNMATIGTLPRTVPASSSTESGVIYIYAAGRTMNGTVQPAILIYYLVGIGQPCVLPVTDSGGTPMLTSTTGNTGSDGNGSTTCVVSIPGPSA
jgi:prepilin-type N-terminal cleavage/methylation domain-containing protein